MIMFFDDSFPAHICLYMIQYATLKTIEAELKIVLNPLPVN